ncbi:MAG: DUF4203 domain-containing protein [Christensenellales bacterium]
MNTIVVTVYCAAFLLGMLHVFFGYKLTRLLLPLCGALFAVCALYLFVYETLFLDASGTYIFFIGSGIAVYLLLFFLPRAAAFFTGFFGGAFFMIFAVYAFNLHGTEMFYTAAITVCVLSGLLAAVYKRAGVIVVSALFGGCISSYAGVYLYTEGANASGFEGIFVSSGHFLSENIFLIGGATLVITLLGIAVQFARTADKRLLEGRLLIRKSGKRKESGNMIIDI